jgi:hypothetical protein
VSLLEFKEALISVLGIKKFKQIDLEFLATKYLEEGRDVMDDMAKVILYDKFFKDFEQLEKYGLKAHQVSDPLAKAATQQMTTGPGGVASSQLGGSSMPVAVKKVYEGLQGHTMRNDSVDRLMTTMAYEDTNKDGVMSKDQLKRVFHTGMQMPLSDKQIDMLASICP